MQNRPNFQPIVLAVIIPVIILITVNWVHGPQISLAQTDSPIETPTAIATEPPTNTPTSIPTSTVVPTHTPTPVPTGTAVSGSPTNTPTPKPTSTSEPVPGLTVEIVGPTEVVVGETIALSVVASNIPEPGIFGYQFHFNWDSTVFSLAEGTLALNPDFPIVAKLDVDTNVIQVGASRQGNVQDLTGPLTLLTVEAQANVVTQPDAAPFTLTGVKLGRKGGIDVPVDQIINLNVTVVSKPNGNITGNVKVEGRAADNQAGHTIQDDTKNLSAVTDTNGNFTLDTVDPGTYTLTANRPGFLAATCTNLIHQGDTLLDSVTLLAGDIDDNRIVDIVDAVAIGSALGSAESGQVTDLNVDLKVDVLDLILMSVNFDQTSENNPWLCQPEGLALGSF